MAVAVFPAVLAGALARLAVSWGWERVRDEFHKYEMERK
jgi:hypothetical protein